MSRGFSYFLFVVSLSYYSLSGFYQTLRRKSIPSGSGILSVPTRNPEIDEAKSCRYNNVNLKRLIAYPISFTDSTKGRDFPCSANENTNT